MRDTSGLLGRTAWHFLTGLQWVTYFLFVLKWSSLCVMHLPQWPGQNSFASCKSLYAMVIVPSAVGLFQSLLIFLDPFQTFPLRSLQSFLKGLSPQGQRSGFKFYSNLSSLGNTQIIIRRGFHLCNCLFLVPDQEYLFPVSTRKPKNFMKDLGFYATYSQAVRWWNTLWCSLSVAERNC